LVKMNFNYLKVRIDDRVGWLEYNYPPINAFNWDMLREVPAALQSLLDDPQVRVVVFASAIGKYFSVGADLNMFDGIGSAGMEDWVSICHGLVKKMRGSRKPLLAAIITQGGAVSFEEGLTIEYESAVKLADTKNFSEGINAFLEKRRPKWK